MIRKYAYDKIFRTTGMLLLLLFILMFPVSEEYELKDTLNVIKTEEKDVSREKVFLLDRNNYVSLCNINIHFDDKKDKAYKLIELMKNGGKYEKYIPNGFRGILPSSLEVRKINFIDDKIFIDLSKDIYDIKKEESYNIISMITYNLTLIENVREVYITVDGVELEYYPNTNRKIYFPLTRKDGINMKNNITKYKNINKTTIYYLNKIQNDYYYIPVTKLNNKKESKIEVIIDELSSSSGYETNLMSLLNYNTKLINYEVESDKVILNFNEYLFDDISSNKVLEEVVHSIELSIEDNYDIKTVIFYVNNNEITKSMIKTVETLKQP